MSRPSWFRNSVSGGPLQLLQKALQPSSDVTTVNNTTSWTGRTTLTADTVSATTVRAANFIGTLAFTPGNGADGSLILGLSAGTGSPQTYATALGVGVVGPSNQGSLMNVVAIGYRAGFNPSTGNSLSGSILIGSLAGAFPTTGSLTNNVIIGTEAYASSSGGSGNVLIGYNVASNIGTSLANTLIIHNNSNVTSPLIRGNFATGQLGINCAPSASYALDVSGTTNFRGAITVAGGITVSGGSPDGIYGGVLLSNKTISATSISATSIDLSNDGVIRGNLYVYGDLTVSGGPIGSDICTGQVVIGVGATTSNYQSLIARTGGLQVCNGYLQINRTESPFQYHLDVSGTSRITGSNLIGGVTLNASNVYTSGDISGRFTNGSTTSNTIGGVLLSNTNVYTSGDISGRFTNGSTTSNPIGGVLLSNTNVYTSGDISGRFTNGSTTSNTIGGVVLSNTTFGLYTGTVSGVFASIGACNGQLSLYNSNGNRGIRMNGGEDGSSPGSGKFEVLANGVPTFEVFGATGNISNGAGTANRIGGLLFSSGELGAYNTNLSRTVFMDGNTSNGGRLIMKNDSGCNTFSAWSATDSSAGILELANSNGSPTITIYGSTGRISNASTSPNTIGGVGLQSQAITVSGVASNMIFLGSDIGSAKLALGTSNTGNDRVVLYGNYGGDGRMEMYNESDVKTFYVDGDKGEISNKSHGTSRIGGVTLGPSGEITLGLCGNIFPIGTTTSILNYLVLGVAVNSIAFFEETVRGNITWTGYNNYRTDPFLNVGSTVDKIYLYPRVAAEFYATTDATGSCNAYFNTSTISTLEVGTLAGTAIGSWKAWII